jgi:hypothetical protein
MCAARKDVITRTERQKFQSLGYQSKERPTTLTTHWGGTTIGTIGTKTQEGELM